MRLILCGKNDAAVRALEFLLARGDEVLVVAGHRDDGVDGWQASLAGAARKHGVPLFAPKRVNAPESVAKLEAFGADRLVSIQYEQILRKNFFDAIGCPCLNLHFALLPRHRGVAPIAWALLEGDDRAGVTLHHMVVEIDGGDVIDQRSVPIGPQTTARELYDAVTDACVELFEASYPFSDALLSQPRVQDEGAACYHKNGDFDFSERHVDWAKPAAELQRWLRAMIFPPMQRPEIALGGSALEVARVGGAIGPGSDETPGTVVASAADGIEIAATGGTLWLHELIDSADPTRGNDEILASIEPGIRLD